jgi:hypothetical protein
MSKTLTLRVGHRKYGDGDTCLCTTLALFGVLSVAMTSTKDSPPPIIADLVPGHNQIFEFDCSSGSLLIDIDKVFAKKLLGEALENRRAIWVERKHSEVALSEIINEKNLIVEFALDEDIAHLVDSYSNLPCFMAGKTTTKQCLFTMMEGTNVLYSHVCKLHQRLPHPQTLTVLAILQLGSFTNGFVHSWCLREHKGMTSFLPSHPLKNDRYCTVSLPNLDLKKSLKCFMKMTYFQTQPTI